MSRQPMYISPKRRQAVVPQSVCADLSQRGDRGLKEEIVAEQIVRRLDPFRQFLEVAAQSNGTIINYANIARDVGADPKTVNSYFSILEDTLVGFLLPAFET